MNAHPDDQVPQTAPVIQRDEDDCREKQVFDIRFGAPVASFTSHLIVRRHPGTDRTTLALAPRKDPPS